MTLINIKYVNEAKVGKKYGTLKTPDGTSYALPAGMAGVFQPNTTVEVPTVDQNWSGNVVHVITGQPHAPAAPAAAPAPQPPPVPSPAPAPSAPAAPAVAHGSARLTDPKDVMIFVTGIVGRAMGSGKFDVTDIDVLTKAALAAFRGNLT